MHSTLEVPGSDGSEYTSAWLVIILDSSTNDMVRYKYACAMCKSGYSDKLIEELVEQLANKDDWQFYCLLAEALAYKKRYQKALIALRLSLEIEETYLNWLVMGNISIKRACFRSAIRQFKKSIVLEESAEGYNGLARSLCAGPSQRINMLRISKKAAEKAFTLKKTQRSLEIISEVYMCLGEYGSAVRVLKRVATDYAPSDVYGKIGMCYARMWRLRESIRALVIGIRAGDKQQLHLLGEVVQAHLRKGGNRSDLSSIVNIGDLGDVLSLITEALYLRRDYLNASKIGIENPRRTDNDYRIICIALIQLGMYKQAIEMYNINQPTLDDFQSEKAFGEAFLNIGEFEKGILYTSRAVKKQPHQACYRTLGTAHYRMGDISAAIESLGKSLALREEPETYLEIARISVHTKDFGRALDNCLRSYRLAGTYDSDRLLYVIVFYILKCDTTKTSSAFLDLLGSALADSDDEIQPYIEKLIIEMLAEPRHPLSLYSQLLSVLSWILDYKGISRAIINEEIFYKQVGGKNIGRNNSEVELDIDMFFEEFAKDIVVFGISHSRIFEGIPGIEVISCPGGTMYGIGNEGSRTGHGKVILSHLEKISVDDSLLVFDFGEVDLRAHIYRLSLAKNICFESVCDEAISRYMNFIDNIAINSTQVVVVGPHCGGGNDYMNRCSVLESAERNNHASYMNYRLDSECRKKGHGFLSMFDYAVSNSTLTEIRHLYRDFFHLATPPMEAGRRNQRVLASRLKDAIQKKAGGQDWYYREDINVTCKILLSSHRGWSVGEYYNIGSPRALGDVPRQSGSLYVLIEIPFSIRPRRISCLVDGNSQGTSANIILPFHICDTATLIDSFSSTNAMKANPIGATSKSFHYNVSSSLPREVHLRYVGIHLVSPAPVALMSISIRRYIDA